MPELGGTTASKTAFLGTGTTGGDGKSQINSRLGNYNHHDGRRHAVQPGHEDQCGQCRSDGVDYQRRFDVQPQPPVAHVDANGRWDDLPSTTADWGWASTQTAGQDALLGVGSKASANTFIRTSSTNQFNSVFTGLDVDLNTVGAKGGSGLGCHRYQQDQRFSVGLVSSYNSTVSQPCHRPELQYGDEKQGILQGDGSVNYRPYCQVWITNTVSGPAGNAVQSLTSLGISVNQDGTLAIDSTMLSQQLSRISPTSATSS